MELRHLKHFMVLARLNSFNQAASQLNLAQPSLSRSIQKMEDLLGVKLFKRGANSLSLTTYGELVLEHGESIIYHVDYLESEIQSLRGIESGQLIIGASPIPSNSLIGPVIGPFIRDNPKISVELKVEKWSRLHELLLKGSLSLFIAEAKATSLDEQDDLIVVPLPASNAIFCCRPEHPLLLENHVYLPTLRDYPLAVARSMPKKLAEQFDDLFDLDRHDFSGLVRFDQFQPIKESLYNCDMVVITPEISVEKELKEGRLVALNVENMPNIKAGFCIVYLKNKRLSLADERFINFILQASKS
ncbi:LysR family transcriptional regulator [Shewanella sp. Choline-02u-19]|uniref:LysR family transcriptional regulator n=1 Tax=unclassified Shewanella TaxID=196818 RepID=UPI000C34CF15|nr:MULTISPECIES: LysR family transcriptional regulator [unclassified Shewanella]PKG76788.1 LysR family transcriptional regulator [Shewanella sp. GutCb]PKH57646.1 LysR family transcriptional regulator [Shewanella sp. Bg11-22]PKI28508.1 LysR family transcriptional regulator [Shewanella sp. Choline-02u-19]